MTDGPGPSRRRMLALMVTGTGLALASGGSAFLPAVRSVGVPDDPRAASLHRVGAAYLDLHPDEASEVFLLARLPPTAIPDGRAESWVGDTFSALGPWVEADFAAGNTVDVAGWQLARTEARAAGVVTLRSSAGRT